MKSERAREVSSVCILYHTKVQWKYIYENINQRENLSQFNCTRFPSFFGTFNMIKMRVAQTIKKYTNLEWNNKRAATKFVRFKSVKIDERVVRFDMLCMSSLLTVVLYSTMGWNYCSGQTTKVNSMIMTTTTKAMRRSCGTHTTLSVIFGHIDVI